MELDWRWRMEWDLTDPPSSLLLSSIHCICCHGFFVSIYATDIQHCWLSSFCAEYLWHHWCCHVQWLPYLCSPPTIMNISKHMCSFLSHLHACSACSIFTLDSFFSWNKQCQHSMPWMCWTACVDNLLLKCVYHLYRTCLWTPYHQPDQNWLPSTCLQTQGGLQMDRLQAACCYQFQYRAIFLAMLWSFVSRAMDNCILTNKQYMLWKF